MFLPGGYVGVDGDGDGGYVGVGAVYFGNV